MGVVSLQLPIGHHKMVAPAEVAIQVVEVPYSLLEKAGLPFSVCVELQENKLDISSAAWTVRKSKSGLSLQLFWPLSVDGPSSGSFVQPPKCAGVRVNNNHRKRCLRRRRLRATCDKITQTRLSTPPIRSALASDDPMDPELLPDYDDHSATSAPASGDLHPPSDHEHHSAAVSQGESDDSSVSELDLAEYSKVAYSVRSGQPGLLCERKGDLDTERQWIPVVSRRRRKKPGSPTLLVMLLTCETIHSIPLDLMPLLELPFKLVNLDSCGC